MSLKKFAVAWGQCCFIMLLVLTSTSGSGADLSTPEKTIATYYQGYITGNKSLTEKTLMGLGRLEDTGFRPPIIENYRITEMRKVTRPSLFADVGDVEITTEVRWKTDHPPGKFRFVLRKYNNEWKITSYSGEGDE